MDFLELCKKRYSLRKYSNKVVPEDVLERIIEAARLAPSACNSQPWHFVVVRDSTKKAMLCEEAFSGIYSMNKFAKEAPVIIVVITEKMKFAAALGGMLRGTQYSLIDIGIACEHLILQAAQEGVGSCMLGWFDENAVKKILGLPKNVKIDLLISLGYPPEDYIRPNTSAIRKTKEEIRTYI